MGDDDIICLSSDDEFTAEELPKKKQKSSIQVPLRAKIEAEDEQKYTAVSNKRKLQNESYSVSSKKSKLVSKNIIEEIIIDSPQKGVSEEPQQRIKIPITLENRHQISVTEVTSLKTSDNQQRAGRSSLVVLNPRNIANRSVTSKQSNNKSITLKSDDWKLTTQELSTKSSRLNNDGSSPSVADVVRNFFSGPNSVTEIPKPLRIESQSNSSILSKVTGISTNTSSGQESSTRLSEIEIGQTMKTPKTECRHSSSSSRDDRSMPHGIKVVKSLNGVTKRTALSKETSTSPEDSSATAEVEDCNTSKKETPRKPPSLFNGIVNKPKMSLSRGPSVNKDITFEKSSSKSQSHGLPSTPIISEVAVVVKRLIPHKLESANVPNHSKSNNSRPASAICNNDKSSKSESSDSSPSGSNESDTKIANGRSENKSEARKTAKIQNGNPSKSGDSVVVAGTSRSPDDTRKKSSKVDKESTRVFEPKPGCSKTPDDVDNTDKPQLVVKTKMPAYTCNQDTFPMFLSLCLQTDRDEAMKKIVAKLKRYYDEMDPAYARSREFEELLNEKRDKIGEKGKKRVYLYTSHVMDEMKRRKRRKNKETVESDKTDMEARTNATEGSAANEPIEEGLEEGEEEEDDDEEARRRKRNIKKIEHAMKKCAKIIQKLEEAEVGPDDDMNSSYMKLDRYQAKMIELWNKMCEYTNEHADAGRAYLRPKHVRVTQIPSVDQAINSFINARLGVNRKKSKKVASFVDGIIFPDYIDILECIAKVNDDQNLRLDKRTQEKIAQKAFTELGEHLQTTRRIDYWDTFSLRLENNEDPAIKDAELAEKLAQNEEINRARTAEVFEEFVKKQEARSEKRDANTSEEEEEDDEEDEDEADKKSDLDVMIDMELMEEEDEDENNTNKDDQVQSRQESIGEDEKDEDMDVQPSAIPEEYAMVNEKNNDADTMIASPAKSPKNSTLQEANEKEVLTVEAEIEDVNKPEGEKRSLLRIRSFAKPPESWQASQEEATKDCGYKPEVPKSNDIETIDVTEDEKIPAVSKSPEKNEQLKTLTIAGKTVVVKRFEKTANGCVLNPEHLSKLVMISSPVTNTTQNLSTAVVQSSNRPLTNQSSRHANLNNNPTNFGQASKYVMIQPHSQLGQSNVPQHVRLNFNGAQISIRNPTISASGQVPRMQARTTQQQGKFSTIQQMQVSRSQLTRLRNGQYIPASSAARNPEPSQQTRHGVPSGIRPVVRQPISGGLRIVQVGQTPWRGSGNVQVMRLANGQLITRPVRPQHPVQISQTGPQRDGKMTNTCDVTIIDPATDAPEQPTGPVLRLRISDNISTATSTMSAPVQQQRVGRPGDQNWKPQSREALLKK